MLNGPLEGNSFRITANLIEINFTFAMDHFVMTSFILWVNASLHCAHCIVFASGESLV